MFCCVSHTVCVVFEKTCRSTNANSRKCDPGSLFFSWARAGLGIQVHSNFITNDFIELAGGLRCLGSPSLVAVRQVIAEISPIPLPGGFGITFFLMNERGLGWESKYMTISCRARSYSSQVPSVAWAPQFSRRCDKNCRCCLQISTPFTFYKGSLEVGNRYFRQVFKQPPSYRIWLKTYADNQLEKHCCVHPGEFVLCTEWGWGKV